MSEQPREPELAAQRLARSSYYSPTPTFALLDSTITDFNIACWVLLESLLGGCRGREVKRLSDRLSDQVHGNLFPLSILDPFDLRRDSSTGIPSRDEINQIGCSKCEITSERFGRINVDVTIVPEMESHEGAGRGASLYWEITHVDQADLYDKELRKVWRHALTWELYAASYDRVLPQLPFYREVVQRHLALMQQLGIERILDLGAGTGNVTLPLIQAGYEVTAVDISRGMLEKLHCKISPYDHRLLTVLQESAEDLPQLKDETFEGVTALLAFYDMRHPESALREAVRLLSPGGIFVATEPKECFKLEVLLESAEASLREQEGYDSLVADWDRVCCVNKVLDPSKDPATLRAETIRSFLKDWSFQDVLIEDSHLGNCATVSGRKPQST